jgi:hypothetical protein
MPRWAGCVFSLLISLLVTTPAVADTIAIGLLSFDVLIPGGPGIPGVNVFNISNLTGNPASGGFALAPDFPVFSSLTLLGSTLTLMDGGAPLVVTLGDIGPGALTPPSSIQFSDTTFFSSAVLSATLSSSSLLLADGSTFIADSTITAKLVPSGGPSLLAGSDFAVIDATSTVPEPSSFILLVPVFATMILVSTIRRKRMIG